MKPSELIARVKKDGGRVWLDTRGRLHAQGVPDDMIQRLRESRYLVTAILREEIATHRWEASGHDPKWWRYVM